MKVIILLLAFVSFAAHASGTFSLEKKGEKVCRIQTGQAEQCLLSVQAQGVNLPTRIELVDRLKAYQAMLDAKKTNPETKLTLEGLSSIGGALLLPEYQVRKLLTQYGRLSIRNLAVGTVLTVGDDGFMTVPFFASVYWQGRLLTQGTLHIEGYLKIKSDNENAIVSSEDSLLTARKNIANMVQIKEFADSTTEQKIESLRWLETGARYVHFRVIGTRGKSVDEATLALIQKTLAPMIFGEVIYVPLLQSLTQDFSDAIREMLNKSLERLP